MPFRDLNVVKYVSRYSVFEIHLPIEAFALRVSKSKNFRRSTYSKIRLFRMGIHSSWTLLEANFSMDSGHVCLKVSKQVNIRPNLR